MDDEFFTNESEKYTIPVFEKMLHWHIVAFIEPAVGC
jgi:hypothetical protein